MIISPDELEEDEEFFCAVLMSTKNYFPQYTLKVDNAMFTKPLREEGYFVTHFVTFFQKTR